MNTKERISEIFKGWGLAYWHYIQEESEEGGPYRKFSNSSKVSRFEEDFPNYYHLNPRMFVGDDYLLFLTYLATLGALLFSENSIKDKVFTSCLSVKKNTRNQDYLEIIDFDLFNSIYMVEQLRYILNDDPSAYTISSQSVSLQLPYPPLPTTSKHLFTIETQSFARVLDLTQLIRDYWILNSSNQSSPLEDKLRLVDVYITREKNTGVLFKDERHILSVTDIDTYLKRSTSIGAVKYELYGFNSKQLEKFTIKLNAILEFYDLDIYLFLSDVITNKTMKSFCISPFTKSLLYLNPAIRKVSTTFNPKSQLCSIDFSIDENQLKSLKNNNLFLTL